MKKVLLFLLAIVSTSAFAEGAVVESNDFPENDLMQANYVYKNAAVFDNMGVYDGTVNANANYEDTIYTCTPGYYLPADTEGCVQCPADNYCGGGTYTFNANEAQGIDPCDTGLFAPAGSGYATQCGHILHIGDNIVYLRSSKKTTPSLHVKIGNDVFYGNMTTTPTYMSDGVEHYFHAKWGDNDYYVCDDTTYIPPTE